MIKIRLIKAKVKKLSLWSVCVFDLVNALRHSHQYCSHVGTKQKLLGWLTTTMRSSMLCSMTISGGGVSLNPNRKS